MVGFTVIIAVVVPVFHSNAPVQLAAVSVTEPPLQTVSLVALMLGVDTTVFVITIRLEVPLSPQTLVQIAE